MKVLYIAFFLLLSSVIVSQENGISNESLEALIERENEERALGEARAKQLGWPLVISDEDKGVFMQVVGVHDDGMPAYYTTDNRDAARTISTNKVHNGGGLGYNLEGQNMTIGEWDGGDVRRTHQEFGSRVTDRDGTSSNNYHATHVAGTLIASGVRSNAKGMAPRANLWAYDWGNDDSEMRSAAAAGLIISNHSYGNVAGWSNSGGTWRWYGDASISTKEDYKFGFYSTAARDFDRTARMYPNYLIVKSAGNDRNDGPSSSSSANNDPTYGSVHSQATSKNNLVVASVKDITSGYAGVSSVQMSSYSCWGPTDDGRIKPDVSANGEGVYSTWHRNNSDYNTTSGTSMAAPNAAGSALLIQQQFRAVNNRFMKASTLKGLIIHTADEAGSSLGPDYRFGWGLMNTAKAVQSITANDVDIEERRLSNRGTDEIKVAATGNRWVRITICWTDIEGNSPSPSLNPTTLMLVNDLDVRLVHSDNTTYFPYRLNPSSPTLAASTGDNFRDNVEQIYVQVPKSGNYSIKISHKGNLATSFQDYSIIYEGFEPPSNLSFNISKKDACIGEMVNFTNTTQGAFSNLRWDFQGANISTSFQASPSVYYQNPGSYWVRMTLTQNGSQQTKVDTVRVHGEPTVNILDEGVFCTPDFTFRRINASLPGGRWNGFNWMFRTDSCVFRPSSVGEGDYPLKYTVANTFGCEGSDSTTVKIRKTPRVSVYVDPRLLCENAGPVTLTGGSPAGGEFTINTVRVNSFNPKDYGVGVQQITYSYTDTSGCTGEDTDEIKIETCVSVDELSKGQNLKFYPNPTSGILIIEGDLSHYSLVEVLDAAGRNVHRMELDSPSEQAQTSIDLTHLIQGVYLVKLSGKNSTSVKRMVKE